MTSKRGRIYSRKGRGGRRGRGGRGRGGEKAPQETHQDSSHHTDNTIYQQNSTHLDYPYSPPLSSRCRPRHPGSVFGQLANFSSPSSVGPVRNISKSSGGHSSCSLIPVMRTDMDEPLPIGMLEFQHCTSQLIGEDLVCENAVKDVKTSVSTGSPSETFGPIGQDNLGVELISQFQGPRASQQVDQQPAASHDHQPSGEAFTYVVSHVADGGRWGNSTTNYAHGTSSLNITEYAKRLHDDLDDDPEEVESALGPDDDCVNGYKVKIECAPLLRAIFEKHGDITSESDIKSPAILSCLLQHLCGIYERLEWKKFLDVSHIELDDMLDEVRYLERQKLNVKWLHEKLEYIYQTKISFQKYSSVKEEEAETDTSIRSTEDELEAYEREISLLLDKISAAKQGLVVKKAKADQLKQVALDIKARVKTLVKQSLVHGLL